MKFYEKPICEGNSPYLRFAKMKLSEIPVVVDNQISFANGMSCNAKTPKMRLLWLHKNLTCNQCGISASFAALESHKDVADGAHLNFYALDYSNNEVMLTWDHVTPKSEGGTNDMKNAQCLCEICNGLKGNDKNPKDVKALRREKGLPIRYEYFGDGSRKFYWTRKQFTTELPGEAQDRLAGED